jgi:hypothetical protein
LLSTIWKVLLIIILVGVIAYAGVCVKANFLDGITKATPEPPDMKAAKYELTIEATRQVYYSNSVDQKGEALDQRVFTLHGFWQMVKGKWVYVKTDSPPLDEVTFGKIRLERRVK